MPCRAVLGGNTRSCLYPMCQRTCLSGLLTRMLFHGCLGNTLRCAGGCGNHSSSEQQGTHCAAQTGTAEAQDPCTVMQQTDVLQADVRPSAAAALAAAPTAVCACRCSCLVCHQAVMMRIWRTMMRTMLTCCRMTPTICRSTTKSHCRSVINPSTSSLAR